MNYQEPTSIQCPRCRRHYEQPEFLGILCDACLEKEKERAKEGIQFDHRGWSKHKTKPITEERLQRWLDVVIGMWELNTVCFDEDMHLHPSDFDLLDLRDVVLFLLDAKFHQNMAIERAQAADIRAEFLDDENARLRVLIEQLQAEKNHGSQKT